MVYTPTTWVASTAPGISATNLNNLETQYTEATSYFKDHVAVSTPLTFTSAGVSGTSSHWSAGDHQHPYGTSTMYADSVTGSILAHTICGYPSGADNWVYDGAIVRRAGTYHIHMLRDALESHTLTLYKNGVAAGSAVLATTTEYNVGDVAMAVGDVLYARSGDVSAQGVDFVLFYNSDGWW